MGIRIAVPPPEEQALIVEAFNKEAAPITLSIQELLQEASLLREYRTRLIADVVTGKLDVREVAAGLPEEVEPSIQSDAAGVDGGEAEDDLDSDPIDTEED
jgi:type I restriction enzyme S subunit